VYTYWYSPIDENPKDIVECCLLAAMIVPPFLSGLSTAG
jgi:hypothetical protein